MLATAKPIYIYLTYHGTKMFDEPLDGYIKWAHKKKINLDKKK